MREARKEYKLFKRASDNRPLKEKDHVLMGIRGGFYYQIPRETRHGWEWVELVPEPSNPHDPHAIAIDLYGARIGYVGTRFARVIQCHIRALNRAGYRCKVPAVFHEDTDGYVALPTPRILDQHPATHDAQHQLQQIWEALPEDLRSRIKENSFHLNIELAQELWKHRGSAPHLFPTQQTPEAFSRLWDYQFRQARHDLRTQEAEERERQKRQREQDKADRAAARDAARFERDQRILNLLLKGRSKTSIVKSLKVGWDTVVRVEKAQSQMSNAPLRSSLPGGQEKTSGR